MIVTQVGCQPRRPEVRVMRDWCRVEWDKFNALLWRTLDKGLLNKSLTDVESVEGAVASLTDWIQQVIDALVPLKWVCCYSRAGWTPELTRLQHRVVSTCCRWIRMGRVSARGVFFRVADCSGRPFIRLGQPHGDDFVRRPPLPTFGPSTAE